jgi:hypothetical protein
MNVRMVTAKDFDAGMVHGHRYTNLGGGFHLDLKGEVTQLTIGWSRYRNKGVPVITWANTYGNVYSAEGKFQLSIDGAQRAVEILERDCEPLQSRYEERNRR